MQAISQFNKNDANIPHHGEHHFAEIFCLRFGLAFKLDVREFADTINQFRHFFAKAAGNIIFGNMGIFDYIMQNGRHNTLVVHVHFSQDTGNSNGVGNIGFAAQAMLAFVCLGTK